MGRTQVVIPLTDSGRGVTNASEVQHEREVSEEYEPACSL